MQSTDLRAAAQQALEALEWISAQKTGGMIQRKATEPITALRAVLAEPVQEPVAWTPVAEALPNSGVKVLACYRNRLGNLRRIRAMWTAAKTEEADSDDAEACSEYDEATDTYYVTEGWYECIDNWGDYSSVAVTEGEVTHWMPLPPDPSTAPPQRPAEPDTDCHAQGICQRSGYSVGQGRAGAGAGGRCHQHGEGRRDMAALASGHA